ncbi:probable serine/threonine-protein kinase DDB_G0282963 [Danaus plexippus]|uniref:probable serine/threonine-protein kinase DDB_G0282963 n=1 Tax=Danaus plexippus TaxID=13037 RepID=UPI002AB1F9DD|nr:probable serine/threonine-protein kinase DDB_G0282963 [Danaus plexippus]
MALVLAYFQPNEEKKHNNNNNNNNNNDAVKDALDDLLKKDEFWQWLTKWTAAYIEVLNENIDRLVKKEVAKQIRKIKEAKIDKQKAANVTANKDVGGKNQTATNSTLAEQNNGTDKSSPMKANSTETPDQSKNHTNVHKTPPKLNSNTIYGNAIDSDHVTNIFIFYPNTANDTRKELENVPNKTKDGVLKSPINSTDDNVATKPSSSDGTKPNPSDGTKPNPSDGTKPNPSDGTKPNPTNGTTAAHSTDKKKDPVPESTTAESSSPNNNSTQNPNSNVANSDVANSTVANSTVANSTVANSTVANSNIVNSTVVNSKVVNSNLANITVANITVANSTDISNKDTPTKTELSSNTATPTSVTPNVSSNPEVSSTNGTTTSNDAAKATTSDTAKPVTQAT